MPSRPNEINDLAHGDRGATSSRPHGINDLARPRPAFTRENAGTRGPRSLHVPVSRIRANTFPCHEFVQTRSRVTFPCNCGHVWPRRDDRKSTRLNSSHVSISYAVFCFIKK